MNSIKNTKKEQKVVLRYTLNFIADGQVIPFAKSTLQNLDIITTNFSDAKSFIDYFKEMYDIEFNIDDIVITYNAAKQTKNLSPIFKKYRNFAASKSFVNQIVDYLSSTKILKRLSHKGHSPTLNAIMCDLKNQTLFPDIASGFANVEVDDAKRQLDRDYLLRREATIMIENEIGGIMVRSEKIRMKLLGTKYVPVSDKINETEVLECLKKLKIVYKGPLLYIKKDDINNLNKQNDKDMPQMIEEDPLEEDDLGQFKMSGF